MTDEKITLGEESPEENLSEILAVRRRKLADLQAAGKDPYQIVKYDGEDRSDQRGFCRF